MNVVETHAVNLFKGKVCANATRLYSRMIDGAKNSGETLTVPKLESNRDIDNYSL